MKRRSGVSALLAVIAGSVLPLAAGAAGVGLDAAYAEEDVLCSETTVPTTEAVAGSTAKTNAALTRMHVPQAQEISRGHGVGVVVIDSGIQPGLGIDEGPAVPPLPGLSPELLSGHGTIVGALIAGPEGVAPQAQVIDVRVFDSSDPDNTEGHRQVTSQGITDGIDAALDVWKSTRFKVVNISLSVGSDDPNLHRAIKELLKRDVVVVASAGNAAEEADDFKGTPDNDAPVYPGDYKGVLAVSASPPAGVSPVGAVVPNADTDVAAPTVGATSLNANGVRCDINEVATSWATAEVSGVVALLRAAYPKDDAKQTVARLMATTEGSELARSPWTGAGVVQAYDALTRSLNPSRSGKIARSSFQNPNAATAPLPPRRLDLFGSSRALLLWFGLGAGALMALAFMLRPLIRR